MNSKTNFVEFSKPFVKATVNVFETMFSAKLQNEKPTIKIDKFLLGDITSILGVNGEVKKETPAIFYKGMVVLSFPFQTYYKMASKLFGKTYDSYSPDIHDLCAEIVNMVVGNSKGELSELGYGFGMSLPSIISGKGHSISYPVGTSVVLITFQSEFGDFYMEVSYVESQSDAKKTT